MKRFRDENGKLAFSLREIARETVDEAARYYRPGLVYHYNLDGRDYVYRGVSSGIALFKSNEKELYIATENMGTFLPDVASEGHELVFMPWL